MKSYSDYSFEEIQSELQMVCHSIIAMYEIDERPPWWKIKDRRFWDIDFSYLISELEDVVWAANSHMKIDEWIQYGIDHKYCSEPVCSTHEGLPVTKDEGLEWDKGYDPCVPGVRLWLEGECPEDSDK